MRLQLYNVTFNEPGIVGYTDQDQAMDQLMIKDVLTATVSFSGHNDDTHEFYNGRLTVKTPKGQETSMAELREIVIDKLKIEIE